MSITFIVCRGGSGASENDVIEAAIQAFSHEFIKKKNDGYETKVGDLGGRLSGVSKTTYCNCTSFS